MSGRVMSVTELVAHAKASPCPRCAVLAELSRANSLGAVAKVSTLRKSPAVRAVAAVHTCDRAVVTA